MALFKTTVEVRDGRSGHRVWICLNDSNEEGEESGDEDFGEHGEIWGIGQWK